VLVFASCLHIPHIYTGMHTLWTLMVGSLQRVYQACVLNHIPTRKYDVKRSAIEREAVVARVGDEDASSTSSAVIVPFHYCCCSRPDTHIYSGLEIGASNENLDPITHMSMLIRQSAR
jgi:hypothetical protein